MEDSIPRGVLLIIANEKFSKRISSEGSKIYQNPFTRAVGKNNRGEERRMSVEQQQEQ
eukprot:gene14463-15965_t